MYREFPAPYDFDAIEEFVTAGIGLVQATALFTVATGIGLAAAVIIARRLRTADKQQEALLEGINRRVDKMLSAPPESYRFAAAVSSLTANVTSFGDDLTRTREDLAYLKGRCQERVRR